MFNERIQNTMVNIMAISINQGIGFIMKNECPKKVMLDQYKKLVNRNEITRIEDLPVEEKKELISECNGYDVIPCCRIVHMMKKLK